MIEACKKIIVEYEADYPDLSYVEYPEMFELYLCAKRCCELYGE